jgi:hypothetical protein
MLVRRIPECYYAEQTMFWGFKSASLSVVPDLRALGRRVSRNRPRGGAIRRYIGLPDAGHDARAAVAGPASRLDHQALSLLDRRPPAARSLIGRHTARLRSYLYVSVGKAENWGTSTSATSCASTARSTAVGAKCCASLDQAALALVRSRMLHAALMPRGVENQLAIRKCPPPYRSRREATTRPHP